MAVTITKQKVAAPKTEEKLSQHFEPSEVPLEELVDMYGSLKDKCDAAMLDPIFPKFAAVSKELLDRINKEAEVTDEVEITGAHWLVEAGPCAKKPRQVVDVMKIAKYLGQETFYKLAKFSVADADKYLTPEQVAEVIDPEVVYTANRKIVAKFLG